MARVALDHLVGRLKAGIGDLGHGQLLVVGLLGRDDGSIGNQREVDARVRHQVGLELCEIHIQSSVEAERGGDGGDYLSDEAVEVGVAGPLDVQVAATDIVYGLVVHHEGTVRVLQSRVGGKDGVVGLHHRSGDLWRRIYGKLQLGLLPVVHGEPLHQERGESGPCPSAERAEHQEPLQPGAHVRQLADAIHHLVYQLLPHRVVAASVVVGGVLFARDELLRMEQLAVGSSANLVHHGGFQVDHDGPRDVLPGPGLAEEGVERVICCADRRVGRHQSVWLDPVLQAVQLPAGVAHLTPGLTHVDRDHLTHREQTLSNERDGKSSCV